MGLIMYVYLQYLTRLHLCLGTFNSAVLAVLLIIYLHTRTYTRAPNGAMKSRFAAINNNVVATSSFRDKCYYQLLYN